MSASSFHSMEFNRCHGRAMVYYNYRIVLKARKDSRQLLRINPLSQVCGIK